MTESIPRGQWLRRELLVRLMLPLLVIVAATAGVGAFTAHHLTDRVFDRWLLDAARSVAALVRFDQGRATLDLPSAAEAVLLYDDVDKTYFSVMQGERLLAGRRDIPAAGENGMAYPRGRAYEARFYGQQVRVARVDLVDGFGHGATVLVAETQEKRQRAAQELMVILWPMLALVLAAAAAIFLVVRRTLRPLELIAARWNERSQASLQPIGDDDLPRELRPFATALNDLLARIRAMLARERQFSATAAHQLRTPLTRLQLGLARAAQARDMAQARPVIEELSDATQRTARLVQQLLSLARLDLEARGDLDFREVDLVALVQELGILHTDEAIRKKLDMEMVQASQVVLATVQPDLVAEALGNLLDNAIRCTPAGGRVLVEVIDKPPRVRVSDSGPGIPEDERQAAFEPFVRGQSQAGQGSGLGLAIVRDIAALHGAKVILEDSPWGGLSATMTFAAQKHPSR